MERILLIGQSGQVGHFLTQTAPEAIRLFGTQRKNPKQPETFLDLGNAAGLRAVFEHSQPDTVILAAAFTHVDQCESDPQKARALNLDFTQACVAECRRRGARMIFFSSEYVFDGQSGPYTENAAPAPLSVYGRLKWEAEELVATLAEHLILRTTWVYSFLPGSQNFYMQVLGRGRQGEPVTAPNDQISTPTSAYNLAQITWQLLQARARGVFHLANRTRLSKSDWARKILDSAGLDSGLVRPVTTRELNQIAPRPLAAGLIPRRLEQEHPEIALWDLPAGLRHALLSLPQKTAG